MSMLRPRTIRGQLISGLILFEILVLAVLSMVLVQDQRAELRLRTDRRIEYQATLLAIQSTSAIRDGQYQTLDQVVQAMPNAHSIREVQLTDMQGRTLVSSDPSRKGKLTLSAKEREFLRELTQPVIFSLDENTREAVAPVRVDGKVQGLVWIYPDDIADRLQLHKLLWITLVSAIFGVVACTIFASLMANSIAQPLGVLLRATRKLIRDPEDTTAFPLSVTTANEAADLTMAFNLMVASIQEQRAGLNDTLALLDSMLANAPIGFAFFDQRFRFVRVNQFLARMNDLPVNRHLGRTAREIFPAPAASMLEDSIRTVFDRGQAVRDLELHGEPAADPAQTRSWLANIYPVRTDAQTVRWTGVILVETTERRRSEEALRRTEKLAAAGRLAASIAHEINNPLEAVTNLLYLIRQGTLDEESAEYAQLAQHEVARVSEIAQQTLRFYRQSTLPVSANVCELLDSVLTLHQGRMATLQIEVVRLYSGEVKLFCFAGELRQIFANFVGNALDAMTPGGGRLLLRIRPARSLTHPETMGVRITVADTGSGMTPAVQSRIFEPFFTTKEATGTGLGLWVTAEIIRKHLGVVKVRSWVAGKSKSGHGTVFTVFFPSNLENTISPEKQELESVRYSK